MCFMTCIFSIYYNYRNRFIKMITHKTNTAVSENSMQRDLCNSDYPYKPVTG